MKFPYKCDFLTVRGKLIGNFFCEVSICCNLAKKNVLRHFLGAKHHFLQACDTWIPHKTKLPNYLQKINSILGIFSFFNFW